MKRDSSLVSIASGEIHTNGHARTDYGAVVAGMLAVARREILALAAVMQCDNDDACLLAAARVRWATDMAREFAGRTTEELLRARPALSEVLEMASRWLPTTERIAVTPERVQRLVVELCEPAPRLTTINADNTLLIAFDLSDLPLTELSLRGSTVTRVTARRAQLEAADLTGARLLGSNFHAAGLKNAVLDRAVVEDCDLSRANLQQTAWQGAQLARCAAGGAVFLDARLGMVTFVECDLRGADFHATQRLDMKGAAFLDCDLRGSQWHGRHLAGVEFLDCRLYGVLGAPDLTGARIERPDLSPEGDGSVIGSEDDAVAIWRGLAGTTWS